MNDITLCPSCLDELPEDYPYDHVAIDLALSTRPELLTAMTAAERAEVVRTGLARSMNVAQLAVRFRRSIPQIRMMLPEHEHPVLAGKEDLLEQIRELWEQDLNDIEIGLRLSKAPGTVNKLRTRMRLPSKFGPGGYRKKVVQA